MQKQKRIIVTNPKLVEVLFNKEFKDLPDSVTQAIGKNFTEVSRRKPHTRNAELFHVSEYDCEMPDGSPRLSCVVEESTYAHYLWTQNGNQRHPDASRQIHAGVVMVTSDNYIVFGKMSQSTVRAGIIQPPGGGIDLNDLSPCQKFIDVRRCALREVREEVGIDLGDEKISASPTAFFVCVDEWHKKIAVMYRAELKMSKEELMASYRNFASEIEDVGDFAEFENLIFVQSKVESIRRFIDSNSNSLSYYVADLLKSM